MQAFRQPRNSEDALQITRCSAVVPFALFILLAVAPVLSQTTVPDQQNDPAQPAQSRHAPEQLGGSAPTSVPQAGANTQSDPQKSQANTPALPESPVPDDVNSDEYKQTHRILGIVPNFSSVSANTTLPPLSPKGKFKLALSDSFDYSSFVLTGLLSAESLAVNSYPELGSGAAGYGRYYWRGFVDQASGTFFTEALVPTLTHEDPRYYTLGGKGFTRRASYALSRTFITRTDSGQETFNISELGGDALEAGLANAYYPPQERGLRKTTESWATQVLVTAGAQVLKEFWPDIRHNILRQK